MAVLNLKNINKVYDHGVQVVFDFNLDIDDKDFVVFVGPSGCGKSTTLRMIAGLEEITSGDFYIDGERMNDVLPKDRDIAMVFQSYALYPHMTVYDNMAFALKLRKMPKEEIDVRVRKAAEILKLTEYLDRRPKALSGGQRQRVALGRAIVRNAKVFLMDEPLSNLDAKLRVSMRAEIVRLHQNLGATTIYVTHDQTEAMTMATKIVVMSKGRVQQIGTPREIYNYPDNLFVASFIGAPAMNFIDVMVKGDKFELGSTVLPIPENKKAALKAYDGKKVVFGVRPENLHYVDSCTNEYKIEVGADVVELLGAETILHGNFGEYDVQAKISPDAAVNNGDKVTLSIDIDKCHFFDCETKNRIK